MVMLVEAAMPSAPSDGETLTMVGNEDVLDDMGLSSLHPVSHIGIETRTSVAMKHLPAPKLNLLNLVLAKPCLTGAIKTVRGILPPARRQSRLHA